MRRIVFPFRRRVKPDVFEFIVWSIFDKTRQTGAITVTEDPGEQLILLHDKDKEIARIYVGLR